jgi:multidrug efflux pump subunit AcrB
MNMNKNKESFSRAFITGANRAMKQILHSTTWTSSFGSSGTSSPYSGLGKDEDQVPKVSPPSEEKSLSMKSRPEEADERSDNERVVGKSVGATKQYNVTINVPVTMSVPLNLEVEAFSQEDAKVVADKIMNMLAEQEIKKMVTHQIQNSTYRVTIQIDHAKKLTYEVAVDYHALLGDSISK